jgi:hypothetical protein
MDLVPIAQLRALPSNMHYGSGCRTLDGLLQWFTVVERKRLDQYGFSIVRVNVDVVIAESPWQMLIGRAKPFAEGATRLRWR